MNNNKLMIFTLVRSTPVNAWTAGGIVDTNDAMCSLADLPLPFNKIISSVLDNGAATSAAT